MNLSEMIEACKQGKTCITKLMIEDDFGKSTELELTARYSAEKGAIVGLGSNAEVQKAALRAEWTLVE